MACANLIGGCFGGGTAPFGVHQKDAERAVEYLQCCVKAQITWEEVERQIRAYLGGKAQPDVIDEQIAQAQQMMLPWLQHHRTLSSSVVNIRS